MEDKKERLNRIYHLAVMAGLCKNKGEFAAVLEVDRTTISGALNGRAENLTDRLMRRAERFAAANGLDGGEAPAPQPQHQGRGVFIPEETLELYTNLSETCRNLSALLTQVQAAVPSAYASLFTPKNYQTNK